MLSSILLLTLSAAEPAELTLTADTLLYDGKKKITNADGHAHFTAEGAAVDADRMVYDENEGAVTAVGHVVGRITQGGLVGVLGDVVTLKLDGDQVRDVYLLEGKAIAKKDTTASALLAANTKAKLEAVGNTQALLEGNHLSRDGTKWTTEKITLVPCECDFTKPSWSIEGLGATIDTEAERVSVVMPVVHVKNVPVLWFPWLSMPLTSRQSGLLFTRPTYSTLNGFGLEQPVFITLGRSVDLTLNPGFFVGASPDTTVMGPVPVYPVYGIAGPRLQAELRYVPSSRATGRAFVGLIYDTRLQRDPLSPSKTGTSPRGLRGELAFSHLQDFDLGFGVRADVNAYSDGFYSRDVTTDVLAATNGFLRSAAAIFQRGDDHLLSVSAVLRQDLSNGYSWFGTAPYLLPATDTVPGTPLYAPGTLQRWPAVTASVPFKTLVGPLAFDFTGEFVRLSPLFSKSGDEGVGAKEGALYEGAKELDWVCVNQRLTGYTSGICPLDTTGTGDRLWQPGEREARDRFMIFPRLHVAGAAFKVLGVSASVGWRQSAWLGEASGRSWQRGTLVVDARAETEFSKSFNGFRHTIQPLAALRAIPLIVRGSSDATSLEPVPYDEVDAAVPRGGAARVQGLVELRQRLTGPLGLAAQLDLGQGFDLLAPERTAATLGESYARLALKVAFLRGQIQARLDPMVGRLTRLSTSLTLDDGKGHGLTSSYENLLDDGTNRTRAPIDLLFGQPMLTYTARAQTFGAGAYWNFGTVGLRYDLLMLDASWVDSAVIAGYRTALSFAQHTVTVSLTPACDCWRVDLYARQGLRAPTNRANPEVWPLPLTAPDFGASVTVSRFGSIGTR